jgi:hypothetical protein
MVKSFGIVWGGGLVWPECRKLRKNPVNPVNLPEAGESCQTEFCIPFSGSQLKAEFWMLGPTFLF